MANKPTEQSTRGNHLRAYAEAVARGDQDGAAAALKASTSVPPLAPVQPGESARVTLLRAFHAELDGMVSAVDYDSAQNFVATLRTRAAQGSAQAAKDLDRFAPLDPASAWALLWTARGRLDHASTDQRLREAGVLNPELPAVLRGVHSEFQALEPQDRARFLAFLSHNLTVAARATTYPSVEPDVPHVERLIAYNEMQHQVSSAISKEVTGKYGRDYSDAAWVFASVFQWASRIECEPDVLWAFQRSLQTVRNRRA